MNTRLLSGYGLLIALALFLGINIIANETLTSFRLDVTENQLYTLSQGTRNILSQLDEPITLRFYYSAKRFAGVPRFLNYGKRIRDMLDEYAASSGGLIKLKVIDPEPFSEAEDQAVGFGIRQIPMSASGEMGYLGVAGTNTADDELAIPLLNPDQEEALEYEITKMIYKLARPKKRIVGVISSLPVFGESADQKMQQPGTGEWAILSMLREFFELRELKTNIDHVDDEIDTLLIIHPKELARTTMYAIDQFVLHGGKAMVFVDPLAEEDRPPPDPAAPMTMPKMSSDLDLLFAKWGIRLVPDKIAADSDAAVRVSFRGSHGPQEVEYLPWLQLRGKKLNDQDFVTNKLEVVNVGSAGALEMIDGASTSVTPLIKTGTNSALIDRDSVFFVRDPAGLLENFKPGGKELLIAARIHGEVDTAFPDGRPLDEKEKRAPPDKNFLSKSNGPINIIVVADSDILADRFWVRFENFLGTRVPTPIANNADFLINSLEILGGNDDLISLRARGKYSRPFEVVEQIQREAEAQYRDRERELQGKLEETEEKIQALQQQKDTGAESLLSPQQKEEIDLFRKAQLQTRKQLRAVEHDLQKNIEKLGMQLKLINIGLIPLVIIVVAIALSFFNLRKRHITQKK